MGCQKCTSTPTLPRGIKNIVMLAAHEYMLQKYYDTFKTRYSIMYEDEYLSFKTDFEDFIKQTSLEKDFTQVELENITILPLEIDEKLSFSIYKRSKTLSYYINLYNAVDLKWILDNNSIITLFQPIIDCSTMDVVAYECLSRGLKQDGSIMSPVIMFESARKSDMLFTLDRACRLQSLKNAKLKNIEKNIFINFTPTSIYNPVFCLHDTVEYAKELKFDFNKIVFEVIETERVENIAHLKNIFNFYIEKGFRVALDDVGSGYSTLNVLAELKPHIVKIDIALIRGIDRDPTKKAIVNSLVYIAKEIGATVLAEGIETTEEFEMVKSLGVNLVQGYLFGKPSADV